MMLSRCLQAGEMPMLMTEGGNLYAHVYQPGLEARLPQPEVLQCASVRCEYSSAVLA